MDGTEAKDGVDPKLKSKTCNQNMDLKSTPKISWGETVMGFGAGAWVDPSHELMWDIDGTGARDGVDPKLRSKHYNPNMVLELDPDLELTLQKWPYIDTHMVIKILDGSSSKIYN